MPGATDRVVAAAEALGLSIDVRTFPAGTRTAADAAAAVGCDLGQIVKSLVFVADGEPFLALTSGANRADVSRLAQRLDAAEVRRASATEARDATGFAIGGTPPFGHTRHLRVLFDEDLCAYDVVWAAAGTPETVFAISPHELVAACGGEVAAFAGSQEGPGPRV